MKKPDDGKIVSAVLSHARLKDAARSLGMSYVSLWRALQNPDVRQLLDEAQKNLLSECVNSLRGGMVESVQVLRKILADKKAAPGLKVSAARVLLEAGIKIISLAEIEGRLREVEKKLELKGR
jgi:hypothetical protein